MIKKVTAFTVFQTAEGTRISIVYSEINEVGEVIKDNQRVDRVILDVKALGHAASMMEYAQNLISPAEATEPSEATEPEATDTTEASDEVTE